MPLETAKSKRRIENISILSVGKQTPCMLSFVYTPYVRERVPTAHYFGNQAIKKNVLHISYHVRHSISTFFI